jgi:hypothetical protein
MISLVERIVGVCDALDQAGLPWALGGALALAYATEEPRGTRDIDVNVFVSPDRADDVLAALPAGVRWSPGDIETVHQDHQVRVWWDDTPIDLFFDAGPFHREVAERCLIVPFAGRSVQVLSAEDLAVFKAMFDRPRDWVDIATMVESEAIDVEEAAFRLEQVLGQDDRVARLRALRR